MNIDELIPYNGKTIQTKKLHEIGYTNTDINKLLDNNIIKRTRRGYYQVNIDCKSDIKLMKLYLSKKEYDKFNDYFNSLSMKDYDAYYYSFLCNILSENYNDAYNSLVKCCEINTEECNSNNLYSYVLLLNELMYIKEEDILKLKEMIFKDRLYFNLFLEYLVNKDYENAYDNLNSITGLNKIELDVLKDLSFKASKLHTNNKTNKVSNEYVKNFSELHLCTVNNNFEQAYYIFNKLLYLREKLNIEDNRLDIIKDLFLCFNYIVENEYLDLNNYKTDYKYNSNLEDSFLLSIKRNDYINSLNIVKKILKKKKSEEYEIYSVLLERIYNFLNIRLIIHGSLESKNTIPNLIRHKKYKDALNITKKTNMDSHDKNILTSILESIVDIDNMKING